MKVCVSSTLEWGKPRILSYTVSVHNYNVPVRPLSCLFRLALYCCPSSMLSSRLWALSFKACINRLLWNNNQHNIKFTYIRFVKFKELRPIILNNKHFSFLDSLNILWFCVFLCPFKKTWKCFSFYVSVEKLQNLSLFMPLKLKQQHWNVSFCTPLTGL